MEHCVDFFLLASALPILLLPKALRRLIEPLSRRLYLQVVVDVHQCATHQDFGDESPVLRLGDETVLVDLLSVRNLEHADGLESLRDYLLLNEESGKLFDRHGAIMLSIESVPPLLEQLQLICLLLVGELYLWALLRQEELLVDDTLDE